MTHLPAPPTTLNTPRRQRARTLEAKDQRRSHLLQAAADLFEQNNFDGVTIAKMAQQAGVAKGTAYLYFSCKEAVFLELVQMELGHWETELAHALDQLPANATLDALSGTIAHTVAQRPNMRRLLVLLHSVIEPQLDLVTARAFKEFLRDLITQLGGHLVRSLPGMTLEQAEILVLQIHALVISITQLASPPPLIAQLLAQDASLRPMSIAFEPFLALTLATLMRGTVVTHPPTC